jgi:hypothetical protein
MTTNRLIARLAAIAASAAVTFTIVAVIADYGLPADGQQLLAQASPAVVK